MGKMALGIVERFTGQKPDVEPEMAILGQRWETVGRRKEEKLNSSQHFNLVVVEKTLNTYTPTAIWRCHQDFGQHCKFSDFNVR